MCKPLALLNLLLCSQDPNAQAVGIQTPPPNAATFASPQDCAQACDYDKIGCAGFVLQQTVDRSKMGTTCVLIRGDGRPGRYLRTVIRADPLNVGVPLQLCPSGWSVQSGTLQCTPITTPVQVVVRLQADKHGCNTTVIQFLQEAFFSFLTDASRSFGLHTASLNVGVSCSLVPVYTVSMSSAAKGSVCVV